MASAPSTARATAPVLWRFRTASSAFGIHIDGDHCWVGNQSGDVFSLDHDGQVLSRFQLPDGVKCLVADDFWIYAGCDDGSSTTSPARSRARPTGSTEGVDVYWLDIHEGVLAVSDAGGRLVVIDHEEEHQWSRNSSGTGAWMVRSDETAVYHGHSTGVTAYSADGGRELWNTRTRATCCSAGRRTRTSTRAPGTARCTDQPSTTVGRRRRTAATVGVLVRDRAGRPLRLRRGQRLVGVLLRGRRDRLWKLGTGCGSALSMQYHEDRLTS